MWTTLAITLTGFFAQTINGTLGMAFGVISTSSLLALSFSPAAASSVVHLAEIGTSAANGTFHHRRGNVNWPVVLWVGIPGGVGAFAGAIFLSSLDFSTAKPFTAAILLSLGIIVLLKFVRPELAPPARRLRGAPLALLGLGGGLIDSTSGGGWGTIVTSTLTASNALEPRKAIGTSSTARLIVALCGSAGFVLGLGALNIDWIAVLALLTGGLIAAPIAARFTAQAPARVIGLATGCLIVILNIRQLLISLAPATPWAVAVWAVAAALLLWGLQAGLRMNRRERDQGAGERTAPDPGVAGRD
jgi:uncharacterized membrane protein YfcA